MDGTRVGIWDFWIAQRFDSVRSVYPGLFRIAGPRGGGVAPRRTTRHSQIVTTGSTRSTIEAEMFESGNTKNLECASGVVVISGVRRPRPEFYLDPDFEF